MDIIGKWKVKQLNIPTLDGVIQCTSDNMPEGELFEEFAPMANAIFEFTPEGSLDMLLSFSSRGINSSKVFGAVLTMSVLQIRATASRDTG